MGAMTFDWRKEGATDELGRLYREGQSCSQIAKALTTKFGGYLSRNAVIGKIHRLRLNTRQPPAAPPSTRAAKAPAVVRSPTARPMPRPAPRATMSPLARQKFGQQPGAPVSALPPPRDVSASVAVAPRHWTERGKGCAWPVAGTGADTLSCCNETGGHTYCEVHRAVMVGSMPRSWEGYSQPGFARKMGGR